MKTYKDLFEKANITILNCFTGVDGGVGYINYLTAMRGFANQAVNSDEGSARLVEIVADFARLIDVINKIK